MGTYVKEHGNSYNHTLQPHPLVGEKFIAPEFRQVCSRKPELHGGYHSKCKAPYKLGLARKQFTIVH